MRIRLQTLVFLTLFLAACGRGATSTESFGALLDGDPNALSEFAGGKALVAHFVAEGCTACAEDRVLLADLQREFSTILIAEVNVADIGVMEQDTVPQADAVFPVIADENGELWRGFQVTVFPTTLLMDREGRVISRVDGALDRAELFMRAQELVGLQGE